MAEYRLSVRARSQLLDIYEFTTATERTFSLLADFPRIGQSAEELAARHRRFRFQSHNIFYRQEAEHVLIRAIFHHAMDIKPQLFE